MKKLANCKWVPAWVSHLGCIKGCLDYLGIQISNAWLYGGTGHAFIINLHEEVCPSGPTAWDYSRLIHLGQNLGYNYSSVCDLKHKTDFKESQKHAWELAQFAIDQGQPCYGWELEIPEFYVVNGYDDVGYYYSGPGCLEGKGPKPWQELGDTGIGVLELYSVSPGSAADDATTVKQALTFAVEHAANSPDRLHGPYRTGLQGFDNWISALQEGKAGDMGMRFNTAVWRECRQHAVGFLEEARQRLAGQADAQFDDALEHYRLVADSLGKVAEIYPWGDTAGSLLLIDDRSVAAVQTLKTAREAEAAGLRALARIISALN